MKEVEKIKEVQEQSQAIGEFIDWLQSKNIDLCKYEEKKLTCGKKQCPETKGMYGKCSFEIHKDCKNHHHSDLGCYNVLESGYQPIHYSMENILADFFKIDLKKAEEERQQILEEFRKK